MINLAKKIMAGILTAILLVSNYSFNMSASSVEPVSDPYTVLEDESLDEPEEDSKDKASEEPAAPSATADTLPGVDEPEVLDPVVERNKLDIAMIPAETIVDVIDTTAISVNRYIAREQQEGASPSEKESLQKVASMARPLVAPQSKARKRCVSVIFLNRSVSWFQGPGGTA